MNSLGWRLEGTPGIHFWLSYIEMYVCQRGSYRHEVWTQEGQGKSQTRLNEITQDDHSSVLRTDPCHPSPPRIGLGWGVGEGSEPAKEAEVASEMRGRGWSLGEGSPRRSDLPHPAVLRGETSARTKN